MLSSHFADCLLTAKLRSFRMDSYAGWSLIFLRLRWEFARVNGEFELKQCDPGRRSVPRSRPMTVRQNEPVQAPDGVQLKRFQNSCALFRSHKRWHFLEENATWQRAFRVQQFWNRCSTLSYRPMASIRAATRSCTNMRLV